MGLELARLQLDLAAERAASRILRHTLEWFALPMHWFSGGWIGGPEKVTPNWDIAHQALAATDKALGK